MTRCPGWPSNEMPRHRCIVGSKVTFLFIWPGGEALHQLRFFHLITGLFFFKFARWFKQKIEFDSNNDDGHMFMVRLRIQEKEAPPSGLVSTLTIIGTQVEDVSNMFHVSLIM